MKTIKKLSFAVVTFVALSFSLSSCDMLSEALSKEVEVEAPAIDFSIGGTAAAPRQKVGAIAEVVWLDQSVNVKSTIENELAKNNLTIDKVKTLLVTSSDIELVTAITSEYNLGNIKLFIDGVQVATGVARVSMLSKNILLTYGSPYDIFSILGKGTFQIKITSDQPKPNIKLDMKLLNKYKSKISLI